MPEKDKAEKYVRTKILRLQGYDSGRPSVSDYIDYPDIQPHDFLRGSDLRGAELNCAKFYGRGGTKELKRSQLPSFLGALGFVIVD